MLSNFPELCGVHSNLPNRTISGCSFTVKFLSLLKANTFCLKAKGLAFGKLKLLLVLRAKLSFRQSGKAQLANCFGNRLPSQGKQHSIP